MRMFCQKLFDVVDFPYAQALNVWRDRAEVRGRYLRGRYQGYSIYVHVRWVLSGRYYSTGSVLGIIRLPRLPVRNCIKAQNEKKH
jgi:hypothetical protein